MASIVPASLTILHEPFALRMKQACDSNSDVPPLNDGRLVWLKTKIAAEGHDVSLQTVMRWYYGAAMPRQKKLISLAKILGVSPSWLSLGRDDQPKVNTSSRRVSTEGAVNALVGHMQMSGLPCAFPEANDEKADLVHFYSIINGRQRAIHVASSITNRKSSAISFSVPASHADAVIMLVVPQGTKGIQVWHIPAEDIEKYGEKDSNLKCLNGKIADDVLSIGRHKIAAIEELNQSMLN